MRTNLLIRALTSIMLTLFVSVQCRYDSPTHDTALLKASIKKVMDVVIYEDGTFYSAFPSVIKRPDGELLVAFRRAPNRKTFGENRITHTDPNSYLVMVRSKNGETWTKTPELIFAHPYGGSQDPCLLQLRDGVLLCASYGWAYIQPEGVENLQKPLLISGGFTFLGGYLLRSSDGGKSWQGPIVPPHISPEVCLTPFGDGLPAHNRGALCEGKSGRIFWAVAATDDTITRKKSVHLITSDDKGISWTYRSPIAVDDKIIFNESSVYETPRGDIVAFLRTDGFNDQACIARSTDGGQSFRWESMGFQGHPLNALRLPDNRVLLTYGYRHQPFGIRARILNSDCTDYATAEEFILRDDGSNGDLGYTWPVHLAGNKYLVAYYFNKNDGIRHIAGTVIEIGSDDKDAIRTIAKVASVKVKCPVGTAPRLPYQLWVTYSDGKSEYRQTRWSNASLDIEQVQADPNVYPVGREYTVDGFITGDNTTPDGYPISAQVKVVAGKYATPSNIPIARTVPLHKVVINGNNRLTSNRDRAIAAIAGWDVSQQLYNYRDTYGFSAEGYTTSAGWDSPDTKLKGHGSGHYMSALALAFAAASDATDATQKNTIRANIARMVNELRECQERTFVRHPMDDRYLEARDFAPESELHTMQGAWEDFDRYKTQWATYGYGYLNAIPAHHPALIEMYRAYDNKNWVWAPYYSIHKQLAGLIDIATYIDDRGIADKALLIAKDMGLWIWNRMHYRTYIKADGTREERRAIPGNRFEMWNIYIAGEDGGTGEALARLSEMVADPVEKERLLEASTYFDSPAFYEPLSKNIDDIRTRHANQHIPKITSVLRSFRGGVNDPSRYNIAENFWNMIQGRYRYSTGGVGNAEMFRQPYSQILNMATNSVKDREQNTHYNPTLNETCCAYNMAKLTKDLNCYQPDDAKYMDYYERVLYNQIVGSLAQDWYGVTYHYAVGLNASKPWGSENHPGNATPHASCCGGTGAENHVKYQEAAYFVSDNTLWVGLYMPTTLYWDEKNVTVEQDCLWPAEHSTIRLTKGNARFTLKLRVPCWATDGFDVKVNGVSVQKAYQPSSYITIPARNWTTADKVEITMPFSKYIDYGPDKMEVAVTGQFTPLWAGTIMYGPLAMTATGVTDWDEATITVDSYLDDIIRNGPSADNTGANGNLYTLTHGAMLFQPDYYRNNNSTHYFRFR